LPFRVQLESRPLERIERSDLWTKSSWRT